MFQPENDGIDHINAYSKGKTELGRLLSNFANTPFVLPEDGRFESIEGYWYWLLSNSPDREELRSLYGFEAKKRGQELINPIFIEKDDDFKEKINKALIAKIDQNEDIKNALIDSELPFDHYYVYSDKMVRTKYDWIIKSLEKIRLGLKYAPRPQEVDLF